MKGLFKKLFIVVIIFIFVSIFFSFFIPPEKPKEISFSQLVKDVNNERVKKVLVSGQKVSVIYNDDSKAITRKEEESSISESFLNYGIEPDKLKKIELETKEEGGVWTWLMPLLIYVLPLVFFLLFFIMIFRQAKTGAMQA